MQKRFRTIAEIVDMGLASQPTIWRQIQSGALPAYRVGRRYLIRDEDIDAWLESLRVVPTQN